MKKATITEMMDIFTTSISKEFVDLNGRLSKNETKALRRVSEYFEKLAEIADSNADFDRIKECLEESMNGEEF